MKLIFAQGNPEPRYDHTRHNVGFMALNELAKREGASFQPKDKFKALVAELEVDDEKVLLVKPQTYYNETGLSARAILDFYKLDVAQDVLVIHDELALPFGTIRTREKGSDAGNNGIKSLNAHLGPDYKRIRFGVGSEHRDIIGDTDFVLGKFSSDEQKQLSSLIEKTHQIIDGFIHGDFAVTTH